MNNWLQYYNPSIQLHSKQYSHWLIDANLIFNSPLKDVVLDTWESSLQQFQSKKFTFIGIPTGGVQWAEAIQERFSKGGLDIIVDDVTTTGKSFKEYSTLLRLVVVRRSMVPVISAWATINLP